MDPKSSTQNLFAHLTKKNAATLIIDHAFGGGSNFYRSDLIKKNIAAGQPTLLLYYNFKNFVVRFFDDNNDIDFCLESLSDFEKKIQSLNITQIFYNNCVNYPNPLEIVDFLIRLKARSTPQSKLIITIHDFFMICPSYALMDDRNQFCGIPDDIKTCQLCLLKNKNLLYQDIDILKWRRHWGECLLNANEIKCFSYSSMHLLLKAYPNLNKNIITIEPHSIHYLNNITLDKNRKQDACLNIGIVGDLNVVHKGIVVINEMASIIKKNNLSIKISIIGKAELVENYPFVSITGEYSREKLPELINESGCHIFFMSSICSETFSYVTHELIQLNLPLAAFNIGAQGEAVSAYKNGFIINEINAQSALNGLISFHKQLTSI